MIRKRLTGLVGGILLLCSLSTSVWAGEQEEQPEQPEILYAEEADEFSDEGKAEDKPVLDTGKSKNAVELEDRILDNVYMGSVNLSGMSRQEARDAINARMEEITGYQIIFRMDDVSTGVSAKDLGVSCSGEKMAERALETGHIGNVISRFMICEDAKRMPVRLDMEYEVDEDMLRSAMDTYCVPMNREPIDYHLERNKSEFKMIHGQRGIEMDMEKSLETVTDYLSHVWKDGVGEIELVAHYKEPKGSFEELSKVQNVLGSGSTQYGSDAGGRGVNIITASNFLNGTILYPGDTLSFTELITPFTEENGYEAAASYANGATVDSLGGGVCQVSTTFYLAVLEAELEVVERHNHSMIVRYVEPAMDAAIAEGSKDFVIRNNLEAPIYIESYAGGGTLKITIYGQEYRPEGRTVQYESEILSTTEPNVVLVPDYEMTYGAVEQIQSAHVGYNAILWKVVTEDGKSDRIEINNSYYNMSPTKYRVGTKSSNPDGIAAMNQAIMDNDLDRVNQARNNYPSY